MSNLKFRTETLYTKEVLDNLEPHSVYAFRVRVVAADGRIGNLSDTVYSNRAEQGRNSRVYCFADL